MKTGYARARAWLRVAIEYSVAGSRKGDYEKRMWIMLVAALAAPAAEKSRAQMADEADRLFIKSLASYRSCAYQEAVTAAQDSAEAIADAALAVCARDWRSPLTDIAATSTALRMYEMPLDRAVEAVNQNRASLWPDALAQVRQDVVQFVLKARASQKSAR